MTTAADIHDAINVEHGKYEAACLEQLAGAAPELDELEEVREYELGADLIVPARIGAPARRVTRLRVIKRHFPNAEPGTEDAEPYYEARGYGVELLASGQPDKRRKPYWGALPDALAKQLLGMS